MSFNKIIVKCFETANFPSLELTLVIIIVKGTNRTSITNKTSTGTLVIPPIRYPDNRCQYIQSKHNSKIYRYRREK